MFNQHTEQSKMLIPKLFQFLHAWTGNIKGAHFRFVLFKMSRKPNTAIFLKKKCPFGLFELLTGSVTTSGV